MRVRCQISVCHFCPVCFCCQRLCWRRARRASQCNVFQKDPVPALYLLEEFEVLDHLCWCWRSISSPVSVANFANIVFTASFVIVCDKRRVSFVCTTWYNLIPKIERFQHPFHTHNSLERTVFPSPGTSSSNVKLSYQHR